MQFLLKLSKYTSLRVHKVETDYSWALIQAVILAFNKKSIDAYLKRTSILHYPEATEMGRYKTLHTASSVLCPHN